jgi:hypothetical protein
MDTRAIGPTRVIGAKWLDASDRHLRKTIAYKVVQVLRRQEKRGEITRSGKRHRPGIWELRTDKERPLTLRRRQGLRSALLWDQLTSKSALYCSSREAPPIYRLLSTVLRPLLAARAPGR